MEQEFSTYLFSLEVAPLNVGETYAELPLHCTLMHRFHTALTAEELKHHVEDLFADQTLIPLTPKEHAAFGPLQKLATTLEKNPDLLRLHQLLYDRLNTLGVTYTEKDWVGDGYTPHVTDRESQRFEDFKGFHSLAVYLIEIQHPLQGTAKIVRHKFDLRALKL